MRSRKIPRLLRGHFKKTKAKRGQRPKKSKKKVRDIFGEEVKRAVNGEE